MGAQREGRSNAGDRASCQQSKSSSVAFHKTSPINELSQSHRLDVPSVRLWSFRLLVSPKIVVKSVKRKKIKHKTLADTNPRGRMLAIKEYPYKIAAFYTCTFIDWNGSSSCWRRPLTADSARPHIASLSAYVNVICKPLHCVHNLPPSNCMFTCSVNAYLLHNEGIHE